MKPEKKLGEKMSSVERNWFALINIAKNDLDIDLSFLDDIPDESSDEIIRLPYEKPLVDNDTWW